MEEIRVLFAEALAIQPAPPVHFVLYFEKDSNRLNSESLGQMADILAAISQTGLDARRCDWSQRHTGR